MNRGVGILRHIASDRISGYLRVPATSENLSKSLLNEPQVFLICVGCPTEMEPTLGNRLRHCRTCEIWLLPKSLRLVWALLRKPEARLSRQYATTYGGGKSLIYTTDVMGVRTYSAFTETRALVKSQLVNVGDAVRILGTDDKGVPFLIGNPLNAFGAGRLLNWREVLQ